MMNASILLLCLTGLAYATAETCVPKNITIDEKMQLVARDNDNNGDGLVTVSDVVFDLKNHYDANNDGIVSEEESMTRWMCAFGDDFYVANFVTSMARGGRSFTNISAIAGPPFDTGVPLEAFLAMNRQRYDLFENRSCINRNLTIDEKLDIIVVDNDFNNDSLVTTADIEHDMRNNYDTDQNGEVSLKEAVLRWICRYGDSAAFARFLWEAYNPNGLPSLPDDYFSFPPFDTGVPLDQFRTNTRQMYEKWAAQGQPIGK